MTYIIIMNIIAKIQGTGGGAKKVTDCLKILCKAELQKQVQAKFKYK